MCRCMLMPQYKGQLVGARCLSPVWDRGFELKTVRLSLGWLETCNNLSASAFQVPRIAGINHYAGL